MRNSTRESLGLSYSGSGRATVASVIFQPSDDDISMGKTFRQVEKTLCLTMDSSRHAGSLGCAPTPIQYFTLVKSSLISLCIFPVES